MPPVETHRLDGLEPENLLAFLALLGLLRVLDEARPDWRTRVGWSLDTPPLRPVIVIPEGMGRDSVVQAATEGLATLVQHHEFNGAKDLKLSPENATKFLRDAASDKSHSRYFADLRSALVSDGVITRKGDAVDQTPLCLIFGQGHQHFLERLATVPKLKTPPNRSEKRNKTTVSETECLHEALFEPWERPDNTPSFRWDPNEDVRYALRANNPTNAQTKETTQHGANRLAAIGLSTLTVVPTQQFGSTRLAILGGCHKPGGAFAMRWPIWRAPISLTSIRALLAHPDLERPERHAALGIGVWYARRIKVERYMNFTRAEPERNL